MGTDQHAQRVVVKRNTCTEDVQQYTESRYIKSVTCTIMHYMYSSLINGIECMCMSQCL